MPPHTRSQRRRQTARPQTRQPVSAETTEYTGTTAALETPSLAPAAPRAPRTARRVLSRPAPEPVDYTADYDAARRDLRWIALWTVILFVAMIGLKFSGVV